MSRVEVVEVESAAQLKKFIRFPQTLFRDDPNFVAPLVAERREFFNSAVNPFYRNASITLFLAMRNGDVVGRVATCIDYRHNSYYEDKTGFFGFFDTVDDSEVAKTLLKVALITLKQTGKVNTLPVVLYGSEFWSGLIEWLEKQPVEQHLLSRRDLKLITLSDDPEEVAEIISRHYHRSDKESSRVAGRETP